MAVALTQGRAQQRRNRKKFLTRIGLLLVVIAVWIFYLFPIVWLLLLPFRVVGLVLTGVFEFLRALILLPARVLGGHR